MTRIIFETKHGSHLYGMATPLSDHDTFVVTDSSHRASQKVTGDVDRTTIGWDTFLLYALTGSHQSVEALFSREKVWHTQPELATYLDGLRVGGRFVFEKYARTIEKFAHADDFKRRRHAVRLWLNLQELRDHGRFDPRLTPAQVAWASELATADIDGDQLAMLLREGRSALGDFLEVPA
jgi:hypothetical protein